MRSRNGSRSKIHIMFGRTYYSSPVGDLLIESEDNKITTVNFLKTNKLEEILTPVIEQCIEELEEYFYQGRKFFTVELKFTGTVFQNKVWNELLTIPYGQTISYHELACRLGDINTIRAVGLANG